MPSRSSSGSAPPAGDAQPVLAPTDVRRIARNQRVLNLCILAYIAIIISQFIMSQHVRTAAGIAISVLSSVFVFKLALSLYGAKMAGLLGLLALVPLLGMVVLLVVNSKATATLRQHGMIVGPLGADPNQTAGGGRD